MYKIEFLEVFKLKYLFRRLCISERHLGIFLYVCPCVRQYWPQQRWCQKWHHPFILTSIALASAASSTIGSALTSLSSSPGVVALTEDLEAAGRSTRTITCRSCSCWRRNLKVDLGMCWKYVSSVLTAFWKALLTSHVVSSCLHKVMMALPYKHNINTNKILWMAQILWGTNFRGFHGGSDPQIPVLY